MRNGTYAEAMNAGFTPIQAGMLARLGAETRGEALDEFKKQNPVAHMSLRCRLLRAFLFYAVDVAFVVMTWTFGVGVTIQNWPLLIGLVFGARFFWHLVQVAIITHDAKAATNAFRSRP